MSDNTFERTPAEKISPLYISKRFEAALSPAPSDKVYRVEIQGLRHYQRDGGRIYKSLTTFLDAVMPVQQHLTGWRERMIEDLGGREQLRDLMDNLADYGTALHIALADFCRAGYVNWQNFHHWANIFLMQSKVNPATIPYAVDELKKDFCSILQFLHDYEVEIIAVEIPCFMHEGVATLIDLVVEMNCKHYTESTPPENRKRHRAIINLKSGKKGFFESHVLQLVGERRAFNQTYSDRTDIINSVYNLAPTDWQDAPTYKIKDQTKAANEVADLFDTYLMVGKRKGVLSEPTRKFYTFQGVTQFGESPAGNVRVETYSQYTSKFII